jgi:hypothetical protein
MITSRAEKALIPRDYTSYNEGEKKRLCEFLQCNLGEEISGCGWLAEFEEFCIFE